MMMMKNNQLYKNVIILSALCGTSFVFAAEDNAVDKKDVLTEMPAAPSGPYRSQSVNNTNTKKENSSKVKTEKIAQRPPQPRMPAPNMNQYSPQPVQVPDWVKNPPYGPKPPAWVTHPPQPPMYGYGQN